MRIVNNNILICTHQRYNPTHTDAETFDVLYGRVYINARTLEGLCVRLRLESKTTIIYYIILSTQYYVYSYYYTHNCAHVHCVPIHIITIIIIIIQDREVCGGQRLCNRHRMYGDDATSNRDRSRIRRIDKHRKLRSRGGGE